MTQDEVEMKALQVWNAGGLYVGPGLKRLTEFANMVVAAEREACAETAENIAAGRDAEAIAEAIRARSDK